MPDELKGRDIICFAGEDWWFHNPHSNFHIMSILAEKNRVLFVNSTGIRMPSANDKHFAKRVFNKLKSMLRYLKKAQSSLWVFTPVALPLLAGCEGTVEKINSLLLRIQFRAVMALLGLKNPVIWVTSPVARDIALHLKKKTGGILVYYCVDNVSEFPGVNREYILEREIALQKAADLAMFVSHRFLEERKKYNPNTRFLGHGVDFDHFARAARGGAEPADLAAIPRPIAGYMGEILGSDLELIRDLAARHPEISFVFVGQPYDDVDAAPFPSNVHFIGKRSYDAMPDYLSAMSCLCLYYRTDQIYNQYRNPKKLLEYLSTGKPVVSVAIHEMEYFKDVVYIAENAESFEKVLLRAMTDRSPDAAAKRMDRARAQTWSAVANQAASYILETLESRKKEPIHVR